MVKKIDAGQFELEAKNSEVAVVDFSATWCGPCKMLAPVLETVSEKLGDKVDFYNVDVDDAPELAGEYRVNSPGAHEERQFCRSVDRLQAGTDDYCLD